MQQIVTANHFRSWIAQKSERVPLPAAKMLGDIGLVYADRYRTDALSCKLRKLLLNAS
jgi:hypothetical protein